MSFKGWPPFNSPQHPFSPLLRFSRALQGINTPQKDSCQACSLTGSFQTCSSVGDSRDGGGGDYFLLGPKLKAQISVSPPKTWEGSHHAAAWFNGADLDNFPWSNLGPKIKYSGRVFTLNQRESPKRRGWVWAASRSPETPVVCMQPMQSTRPTLRRL